MAITFIPDSIFFLGIAGLVLFLYTVLSLAFRHGVLSKEAPIIAVAIVAGLGVIALAPSLTIADAPLMFASLFAAYSVFWAVMEYVDTFKSMVNRFKVCNAQPR